jgi:hypothetical protein
MPVNQGKLTGKTGCSSEKWQISGCGKFLYPAWRACQANVNFA